MALRRPSPAILGSIALHVGVAALALLSWPRESPLKPMTSSVPVSIVSSEVIEAGPADNPSEEPVTEDGATAPMEPVEAPPQPTPAPPTPPAPVTPRPPTRVTPPPAPTPRPTPARPTPSPPARPSPPRPNPTPPSPAPRRNEPSLDLSTLAGPPRPTGNPGRPRTGQQGAGQASQNTGPQITASFNKVYQFWNPPCQTPSVNQMRIQMDVTLSPSGRIVSGPTLVSPQSGAVWRAVADGAMQALIASQPFEAPLGFEGGQYRPTFNVERACRNQ